MTAKELRDKSVAELNTQLVDLARKLLNYRLQHASGQLSKTHLMNSARREVARVKTVLVEKRRAPGQEIQHDKPEQAVVVAAEGQAS